MGSPMPKISESKPVLHPSESQAANRRTLIYVNLDHLVKLPHIKKAERQNLSHRIGVDCGIQCAPGRLKTAVICLTLGS